MTWRRRSRWRTGWSCSPPDLRRARSASSPSICRGLATWRKCGSRSASSSCTSESGSCSRRRSSRGMRSKSTDSPGVRLNAYRLLLLFAVFGVWHILTASGILPRFFFGTPTVVLQNTARWFISGKIYGHLGVTLVETVLAFAIGTGLGLAIGLWLALAPIASNLLEPYIKAANAMPRVILAPIFSVGFGLGILSKVALGVTLVFFIVFFNVYQGVKDVSPVVLANARMLGATRHQLLRYVYLPSATAWVFSSLHTSIGMAFVGAVVGEYLGSSAGVFADDRAHERHSDRGVQARENPCRGGRQIHVSQQLVPRCPEHTSVREHDRTHVLDALVDVEKDDEEHQRDTKRDLGEDAEPEQHREDRRQNHPGHRVSRLDVGLEEVRGDRREREPEPDREAEPGPDGERQHGLDQSHAEVSVDLATDEPARRILKHHGRSAEEEARENAARGQDVPHPEYGEEQQQPVRVQSHTGTIRASAAHTP